MSYRVISGGKRRKLYRDTLASKGTLGLDTPFCKGAGFFFHFISMSYQVLFEAKCIEM